MLFQPSLLHIVNIYVQLLIAQLIPCSHQQQIVAPMLVRGDEFCNFTLRQLTVAKNVYTSPVHQEQIIVNVETSKANAFGEKVDQRALVRHANVHLDPLLNLAFLFFARLSGSAGQPIRMESFLNGDW